MSLRRFLTIGLFFLFIFGSLMAGSLWYSTHQASGIVEKLTDSVESVNVAHLVQESLTAHRRQFLQQASLSASERTNSSNTAEQDLLRNSKRLSDYIATPEERTRVENVQNKVRDYLKQHDLIDKEGKAASTLHGSVFKAFDEAQLSIQELMRFNLDEAIQLQAQSVSQNYFNYVLVVCTFGLFGVVFLILLIGLKSLLFKPILRLESAIDQFEVGKSIEQENVTGAQEVLAITTSFNRMASRLSKQKETQLMFIASVAHDLKNPMAAISMANEIASEDSEMSTRSRDLLAMVKRQIENLNRLVGDLLDTTRIESGHLDLDLKACDLKALLQDAVLLHSSISPIHKIQVELPDSPVLLICDGHRILQVFNNLLSNAIKYSPFGGMVCARMVLARGYVTVSVSDEGVGIPADEVEDIFEPFRRSSLSRSSIPGVGLGLSVAKKIIKAHEGGEILVHSKVDQGTEVCVTFKAVPVRIVSQEVLLEEPSRERVLS